MFEFETATILLFAIIIFVVIGGVVAFLANCYTVVPPYQAHVVVSRSRSRTMGSKVGLPKKFCKESLMRR